LENKKEENNLFWEVIRPKKEDKTTGEDYIIIKCTIKHTKEHSETFSKIYSTNYFKKILGVENEL